MQNETFSHLVEIDEISRMLKISRLFSDGKKQFYTEVQLPPASQAHESAVYTEFARTLGENILLDSPAGRRSIGL